MSRLLVIPAAGLGSRLGASVPKVLVRVAGETMLDRLLALYRGCADRIVVVVNPAFSELVRSHVTRRPDWAAVDLCRTSVSDGHARRHSSRDADCDAVQPVEHLGDLVRSGRGAPEDDRAPGGADFFPCAGCAGDADGRANRIRTFTWNATRRVASSACFIAGKATSCRKRARATWDCLRCRRSATRTGCRSTRAASRSAGRPASATFSRSFRGSRGRETVTTFPSESPIEAVGVNTPEELAIVEQYLSSRSGSDHDPHSN